MYSSGKSFCEVLCAEEKGQRIEEFIIMMGLHEERLSCEVTHHTRRKRSAARVGVQSCRVSSGGVKFGGGMGVGLVRQQGALLCCQTPSQDT